MTRINSNVLGGVVTFWPTTPPQNKNQTIGFASEADVTNRKLSWVEVDNSPFMEIVYTSIGEYKYYGGLKNGSWKINRYDSQYNKTSATSENNEYEDLDSAWTNRESLTYE